MISFLAEKRRKIRKITPVKGINLCYTRHEVVRECYRAASGSLIMKKKINNAQHLLPTVSHRSLERAMEVLKKTHACNRRHLRCLHQDGRKPNGGKARLHCAGKTGGSFDGLKEDLKLKKRKYFKFYVYL